MSTEIKESKDKGVTGHRVSYRKEEVTGHKETKDKGVTAHRVTTAQGRPLVIKKLKIRGHRLYSEYRGGTCPKERN